MDTKTLGTLMSAVGCGIVGGFLLAFSVCVMRALALVPPSQGIHVMQTINVVVLNPWFLGLYVGMCLPCAWFLVLSLRDLADTGSQLRLAGALVYLLGSIAVTVLFNVPRNEALAVVAPESVEGAKLWADFLGSWTAWNHVRTVCSCLASGLFALAARL